MTTRWRIALVLVPITYCQLQSLTGSHLRPGQDGGHLQRVEISRLPHRQERLEQPVQDLHVGVPL